MARAKNAAAADAGPDDGDEPDNDGFRRIAEAEADVKRWEAKLEMLKDERKEAREALRDAIDHRSRVIREESEGLPLFSGAGEARP